MHATVSGCGDNLAGDDAAAIEAARAYFSYLPGSWREAAAVRAGEDAVGLAHGRHDPRVRPGGL